MAITPVIAGRTKPGLYAEMNPGVAVVQATTALTGFTTASVAGKRRFGFYAPRIRAALADTPAVFVSHTPADAHALAGEFARLENPDLTLPPLRLLDTSLLAGQLNFPGARPGVMSLEKACEVAGVRRDAARAHHARYDARITAALLARLLGHAAATGWHTLDDLLDAYSTGTLTAPPAVGFTTSTSVGGGAAEVVAAHQARHGQPPATDADAAAALVELAGECVKFRCGLLAGELAGQSATVADWWPGVWALLATAAAPGQAGTLLGALRPAFAAAVPSNRAVGWWAKHKARIAAATACEQVAGGVCPDCRAGGECPRDVFYTTVAEHAALCGRPALTKQTVKYKLFSAPGKKDRRVRDWAVRHPELAAAMTVMVVEFERDNGGARSAAKYLTTACEEFALYRHSPGLAVLWVAHLGGVGRVDDALAVVSEVSAGRTTEAGYAALDSWVARLGQAQQYRQRTSVQRDGSWLRPAVARPPGRVRRNRFRVSVDG